MCTEGEYKSEHMATAENLPLDYSNEHMGHIDKNKTYYVHCAGGYRSMIFTSIFKAIKDAQKFELTDTVCPSTLQ